MAIEVKPQSGTLRLMEEQVVLKSHAKVETFGRAVQLPTPGQSLVLAAGTIFTPGRIWATNMIEIGFPDGLLVWCAFVWLAAAIVWTVVVLVGGQPGGVTYAVFWLLIAFGSTGSISDSVPGGTLTVIVGTVAISAAAYLLEGLDTFRMLTSWAIVAAVIVPVGLALAAVGGRDESQIVGATSVTLSSFEQTPDVVIVVLDAYGSLDTLRERFNFDTKEALEAFDAVDLRVAPHMMANYTLTHLSLASFFEMDYPIEGGVVVGDAEWSDLLTTINGENQLVSAFKSQGYRFVMVESGWPAIRCGRETDVCIGGPWPDEAVMLAKNRSVLGGLNLEFMKDGAVGGSLNSIRWLQEELPVYVTDGTPDLIFLHLLLPHPPLYLDEACQYTPAPGMGGRALATVNMPEPDLDRRKSGYNRQVQCTNQVLADVAAVLDDDAILLAFGDHGPDSMAQLFKAPKDWSDDALQERFRVIFLTNRSGCHMSEVRSLVNVGRRLLSCLSNTPVETVKDRHFVAAPSFRRSTTTAEPLLEMAFESGNRPAGDREHD